MTLATLAFDRSMRRKDEFGHLHVGMSNLSKATVNPYYGREIPGSDALGLDPDRIYQMLRHPDELAAAAHTFNNIRLLSQHAAVSAADPKEDLVAGSTGTDAAFVHPYLTNSLVIWRQEDIDDVEAQDKCELSCSYAYDPDMTPGEYQGLRHDGVMRNIRANHVALVKEGRAGPDVMVHDSKEISMPQSVPLLSRKAVMAKGALAVYLKPKLLTGTVLALDSALGSVNRLNWKTEKPKVLSIVRGLVTPHLAADAKLDDLALVMDGLDDMEDGEAMDDEIEAMDESEREEEMAARKKEADDKMPANDRMAARDARRGARDAKRAMDKAKDENPDADKDDDETKRKEAEDKAAKDAAAMKDGKAMDAKLDAMKSDLRREFQAVAQAREDVRPIIGQAPIAMDSAGDIYKLALDHLKVDTTGVDKSAYRALLNALPKPGARPALAMDAVVAGNGLMTKFPNLARINQA